MQQTKHLWRGMFFIILIAALCGGLALPAVSSSARAAPPMQVATDVVISEFRFHGSGGANGSGAASDEFVEIYNPTALPVNLRGWQIRGSSSTGTSGTRYPFPTTTDIFLQPGQHYLVANTGYNDAVPADVTYGSGIADDGGLALLRADNSIADQVGLSTGSLYQEGTVLPSLTSNTDQSYERQLDGSGSCIDSNNNVADFFLRNPSDPQNSSSPITTCGNATPTPSPTTAPTNTPTAIAPLTVLINEVAWSGTAASSNDEWFELYNPGSTTIDLTGWRLLADDGNPDIPLSGTILAGDYFVVARNSAVFNTPIVDLTYSSGSFSNNGEILYLLDPNGNQVDTANLAGGSWPAGTPSPAFASMERQGRVVDSPTAWATYGGTTPIAFDRNGGPIKGTPGQANWVTTITATPTVTSTMTATPTSTGTPPTATPTGGIPKVLINEVAWAGTLANSDDEWIELFNPGSAPMDITGWQLYADDGTLNKVGTPNITLNGTIPAGGFFLLERVDEAVKDIPANQVYGTGTLSNSPTGERLYLNDKAGTIVDTANSDGGAWPAGIASPTYATMERVGTTSQWVTYGGTIPVAYDRNSNPIKGTPGRANWISTSTITTITSDLPDPSLVNQNVTVSVTVMGGMTIPTGTVTITGANTNCSITLSNGAGSCVVKFTSIGAKTIAATYGGDSAHPASSDTESHQVSTTTTAVAPTRTPRPTPLPPPPLIAINEFVPRPGHDWNSDGEINAGDEYIELLNHGVIDVNLSGYTLDDEVNIGSTPFSLPSITLKPGERRVFYASETGLLLSDGGDGVRLLKPNGQLGDAYNYTVVRFPDQSYCRLPDNGGADDWNENCFPTPGLQNSLSGSVVSPPTAGGEETLCPIADILPDDFVLAECLPIGGNIWNPAYWDLNGWFGERFLPKSPGKWNVFVD